MSLKITENFLEKNNEITIHQLNLQVLTEASTEGDLKKKVFLEISKNSPVPERRF